MPDSKEGGKGPEIPRPMKPAVPPFRGPGTGGPSPLRPVDPKSRLTRPPFIPPAIGARKPFAAPARPSPAPPVGAASIPEIGVPADRAQELVEAIRPMSSSTSTPASSATPEAATASASGSHALTDAALRGALGREADALTPTPVEATAVTSDSELPPSDASFRKGDQIGDPGWAERDTGPGAPGEASAFGQASPSATIASRESQPFVDPAPFVGTRPTVSSEPAAYAPSGAVSPDGDLGFSDSDIADTASAAVQEIMPVAASHPLARALNELAARIDNGDVEVGGYEEGMSPEAALAATLAAMLKRAR